MWRGNIISYGKTIIAGSRRVFSRGCKNFFKGFLKLILIIIIAVYVVISWSVMSDYIKIHYGNYNKFLCSFGTRDNLQNSVVRIVGGYSEGSGFFIAADQIITNFHVITDEPSPKIILPDGNFITPSKILGNEKADLAVLFTESKFADLVMPLPDKVEVSAEEPIIAGGYAMGTDLVGKATVLRGNFVENRKAKKELVAYLQTTINLVEGMSGGPLVDQCGRVLGIGTKGLAGLSLFISADNAKTLIPAFTDEGIEKIEVDPAKSPADAVIAFYTYLKARRMRDGFNLLSQDYLQNTNYEEWTSRFKDILDVIVIKTQKYKNTTDRILVKFVTQSWIDGELEVRYYEGVWRTVKEDGVYKMLKSDIGEINNPTTEWFYE